MQTQNLPSGPAMMRTSAGQWIPASAPLGQPTKNRKFLIVLPYFEGDQQASEELGTLIADLERIRDRETDILVWGRFDAPPYSPTVIQKLEAKFGVVRTMNSKRNARNYPYGANGMFYDLVSMLGQMQPWASEYYAFVNLEADCVPLHPGWIGELQKAYRSADQAGKSAAGFIHDNPIRHLNGVAVWAIDIWRRVGTAKLSGGSPQIAYDIYHANNILPHADQTPYIVFDYRRPTISADDLYAPREVEPAIYHGVKDGSARAHVRERHLSARAKTESSTVATVFAYDNPTPNTDPADHKAVLSLWREGWRSRKWNPIVLQERDAARQPQYAALKEAVAKFPCVGEPEANLNRFARWLALLTFSGGFMVDLDVLPSLLTPDGLNPKETGALSHPEDGHISAAIVTREQIQQFIAATLAYDPKPEDRIDGRPHVTDHTVWSSILLSNPNPIVAAHGEGNAPLVRFPAVAGEKQAAGMQKFLKGT